MLGPDGSINGNVSLECSLALGVKTPVYTKIFVISTKICVCHNQNNYAGCSHCLLDQGATSVGISGIVWACHF